MSIRWDALLDLNCSRTQILVHRPIRNRRKRKRHRSRPRRKPHVQAASSESWHESRIKLASDDFLGRRPPTAIVAVCDVPAARKESLQNRSTLHHGQDYLRLARDGLACGCAHWNTSSIPTPNAPAILNASFKDGEYRFASIAIIVCRVTPTSSANSRCVISPFSNRNCLTRFLNSSPAIHESFPERIR